MSILAQFDLERMNRPLNALVAIHSSLKRSLK